MQVYLKHVKGENRETVLRESLTSFFWSLKKLIKKKIVTKCNSLNTVLKAVLSYSVYYLVQLNYVVSYICVLNEEVVCEKGRATGK